MNSSTTDLTNDCSDSSEGIAAVPRPFNKRLAVSVPSSLSASPVTSTPDLTSLSNIQLSEPVLKESAASVVTPRKQPPSSLSFEDVTACELTPRPVYPVRNMFSPMLGQYIQVPAAYNVEPLHDWDYFEDQLEA